MVKKAQKANRSTAVKLLIGVALGVAGWLSWTERISEVKSPALKPSASGFGSKDSQLKVVIPNLKSAIPAAPSPASALGHSTSDKAAQARLSDTYGTPPMHFEPNHGQTDKEVKFLSRGRGYTLFLTSTEAVMVLREPQPKAAANSQQAIGRMKKGEEGDAKRSAQNPSLQRVVRMKLVGGNPDGELVGLDELPGKSNYFMGNDPKKWRANIPHYAKVKHEEIYPGIDLIYYGNQGRLEYDFVVAPGADPGVIRLAFEGADTIIVDEEGHLLFRVAGGQLRLRRPLVYQEVEGARREIAGSYVLDEKSATDNSKAVGFQLASYDRAKPLIIDPVIVYATYLGGGGADAGSAIAVDAAGSAYVTGSTASVDLPTMDALQAGFGGGTDAFATKLNAAGTELVYSTYIGGAESDIGNGIALDADGNVYVAGESLSADFPTTENAFQIASGGGSDAFVVKLNPDGAGLAYSTFLGGAGLDSARAIALDAGGNAYVAGVTRSDDFPVSAEAFQMSRNTGRTFGDEAFVTKLDSAGSALVYSTYLGGESSEDSAWGIAVDADGNAFVVGTTDSENFPTTEGAHRRTHGGDPFSGPIAPDAFLTKFDATGSNLLYSTYLGSGVDNFGRAVTVDAQGDAYATGESLFLGTFDAFLGALNADGTFVDCGPFRFDGDQSARGIAVHGAGQVYITGGTPAPPLGTHGDAFVARIVGCSVGLSDITFVGGSGADTGGAIAIDQSGNIYVTGSTHSADFPATAGAFQTTLAGGGSDAFIVKLTDPQPLVIGATALPEGEVGMAYNAELEVSGGIPPYEVTVTRGALPPGLSFGSPTISGTPNQSGKFKFTVSMAEQQGATVSRSFSVRIFRALSIATTSLKAGKLMKKYSAALKATGGKQPYSWSIEAGSLPDGLALNPATGKITGVIAPTAPGSSNLTFRVTDALGVEEERDLTLLIPGGAP